MDSLRYWRTLIIQILLWFHRGCLTDGLTASSPRLNTFGGFQYADLNTTVNYLFSIEYHFPLVITFEAVI